MYKIRSVETTNNTYYLGYGRMMKTTYEQQKEQRERFLRLLIQRIVGVLLIVICTVTAQCTEEGMFFIVGILLGSLMLFSKTLFE